MSLLSLARDASFRQAAKAPEVEVILTAASWEPQDCKMKPKVLDSKRLENGEQNKTGVSSNSR